MTNSRSEKKRDLTPAEADTIRQDYLDYLADKRPRESDTAVAARLNVPPSQVRAARQGRYQTGRRQSRPHNPISESDALKLHSDYEDSLLGIREFARSRGLSWNHLKARWEELDLPLKNGLTEMARPRKRRYTGT